MVNFVHKDENTCLSTNHARWFPLVIAHFLKMEMEIPFLLTGVPEGTESYNILLNMSQKEEKLYYYTIHYIIYKLYYYIFVLFIYLYVIINI